MEAMQQIAFGFLLPQVRFRSIKRDAQKTRDVLRRFQVQGTFESQVSTGEQKCVRAKVDKLRLVDRFSDELESVPDALATLIKN
jgi:hypothetical protein